MSRGSGKAHTSNLTHREAKLILNGRIVPKVTYLMPVTTFNADQCSQLNTAINRVMFNKLGFNRHMPHAVMYSPPHMCGYSFPCVQITQDQKGLLSMLQHFRWNKTVGNDMLVVLSAIQLVSGLCKPILEVVTTSLRT